MEIPEIYRAERYVYGKGKEQRYVLKYDNKESFAINFKDLANLIVNMFHQGETDYKNIESETIHCIRKSAYDEIEVRIRTPLSYRELRKLARIISEYKENISVHDFIRGALEAQKKIIAK